MFDTMLLHKVVLSISLHHSQCKKIYLLKYCYDYKCFRLLKAAEEYHLPKALKVDKGGGLKEVFVQDYLSYEGSHNDQCFFTSEERQWLVLRLLESIRAKSSDLGQIPDLNLIEGQPIGENCDPDYTEIIFFIFSPKMCH